MKPPKVETLVSLARDLMILGGGGLISYGSWIIYPPAGYVVGGALLLAGGVIGAVRERSSAGGEKPT